MARTISRRPPCPAQVCLPHDHRPARPFQSLALAGHGATHRRQDVQQPRARRVDAHPRHTHPPPPASSAAASTNAADDSRRARRRAGAAAPGASVTASPRSSRPRPSPAMMAGVPRAGPARQPSWATANASQQQPALDPRAGDAGVTMPRHRRLVQRCAPARIGDLRPIWRNDPVMRRIGRRRSWSLLSSALGRAARPAHPPAGAWPST